MPDVLVRCVMSLYDGATIMVRVDSELSKECKVNVGMHHGSVPSSFLFTIVINVVTALARKDVSVCCLSPDEFDN